MSARDRLGPTQPYFTLNEVEEIAARALDRVSLYPRSPGAVRIERFVETHFRLGAVVYASLGPSILGYTRFESGVVTEIGVSAGLCEDDSVVAERRVRSTLAHEAGHGLLHAALFGDKHEPSLFDQSDDVDKQKVLCRDEGAPAFNGKWWEYQANLMIGALLLPKALVYDVVLRHVDRSPLGVPSIPAGKRHIVGLELADVFDVNPIVAQIRLDALMPRGEEVQLTL